MDSGMNYFLSKPIRRPQLKKVLREYCAPIPEENEDPPTPGEERRGSAVNTTIVMVNGAHAEGVPGSSSNGHVPEDEGPKTVATDHIECVATKNDGV
jgi:osomolarity two-component system sensor histidine kinase SLN1